MKKIDELIEITNNDYKYSNWSKNNGINTRITELIKEIEEVRQAVTKEDTENLKEELGDVLWDTFCLIKQCEEKYDIKLEDSLNQVIAKLKRRKPHIFEKKKLTEQEELEYFYKIKKEEKESK